MPLIWCGNQVGKSVGDQFSSCEASADLTDVQAERKTEAMTE